jgi:hypothetical protein
MRRDRDPVYIRSDIIEKAQAGEITGDQAEAEAKRLGVGPLATKPAADTLDAMAEPYWTMVMAVAWIAWRTPEAVRDQWDEYRSRCFDWHFRRSRIGFDGPIRDGWFLEQRGPSSLLTLQLAESFDRASSSEADLPIMSVAESEEALMVALRTDCFPAFGLQDGAGERRPVPAHAWIDLKCMNDRHRDYYAPLGGRFAAGVRYDDVRVRSASVAGLWQAPKPRPSLTLPQVAKPERAGFMPLFQAALWIATRGGSVLFDPESELHWQSAYAELIDAMSTGEVRVTGIRDNVRQAIDGAIFAGCRVDYPYQDAPISLILSDDFYIQSYPYIDDEHWRGGFDDSFQNRRETRWKQMMVAKADVARLWPFTRLQTGAPGRPTSMHLVKAEFEARGSRGEVCATLNEEARFLAGWLQRTHPANPIAQPKSIANAIRATYNAAKRA